MALTFETSSGGDWIKGKENMKFNEMKEILDSFEEKSVLKTKDKPENLQDLIAVSGNQERRSSMGIFQKLPYVC